MKKGSSSKKKFTKNKETSLIFKNGELEFDKGGKSVMLSEFHRVGLEFKAPYTVDQARTIASNMKTFLKVRK